MGSRGCVPHRILNRAAAHANHERLPIDRMLVQVRVQPLRGRRIVLDGFGTRENQGRCHQLQRFAVVLHVPVDVFSQTRPMARDLLLYNEEKPVPARGLLA